MNKIRELTDELSAVLGNRLWDSILPPAIFVLSNSLFGLNIAMASTFILAVLIAARRVYRKEELRYAFAGLGSVIAAFILAWVLDRTEGYFIPSLASNMLTLGLCIFSLIIGRPLTAWTSHLARRWPLEWYCHARVRPAYTLTTLSWMVFFGSRFWWQLQLFRVAQTETLSWVNAVSGWPALLFLLVVTYLWGIWLLQRLKGPSVEEFIAQAPPPWRSQRRGF